MADTDAKQNKPQKLTDEQITSSKYPRRSFLAATGALLAGAVAVASGARAFGQQQDPDKQKDPDKKTDPDKKKTDAEKKAKRAKEKVKRKIDPDAKKYSDKDKTDKKKDPDKPKIPDPKGTRY
ncbi:MAG TPA: hypothetical protein VN745_04665 [Verrucomicrobiae bacterium]|nr:hypothetical protein [Verrucomicrobiae bacterium]